MPFLSQKQSIGAGIAAFVLSLSCCWLPALIIGLGGATSMLSISDKVESFSGILMTLGAILIGYGCYRVYTVKKEPKENCCDSGVRE